MTIILILEDFSLLKKIVDKEYEERNSTLLAVNPGGMIINDKT